MRHHAARTLVLTVALAGSAALTGCGGGSATPATSGAPSAVTSSAVKTTAAAKASTRAASVAPTTATGQISLMARGASSKACAAMGALANGSAKIGAFAGQGKVTQALLDGVFTAAAEADLPGDAKPLYTRLKAVSSTLVGKDAAAAGAHLGEFSSLQSEVVAGARQVCR
jgi:hypothetical protein